MFKYTSTQLVKEMDVVKFKEKQNKTKARRNPGVQKLASSFGIYKVFSFNSRHTKQSLLNYFYILYSFLPDFQNSCANQKLNVLEIGLGLG